MLPARIGLAGAGLLPSAPWHATQTVEAICFPRSKSGFAAGAGEAPCASVA